MKEQVLQKEAKENLCTAAIFLRNNKVLMGERLYDENTHVWAFPGGRSDPGENIKESLIREVREEVGFKNIEIKDFIGEFKGSYKDDEVLMFLCETNEDPKLKEPEKFSEWKWIDLEEIPESKHNIESKKLLLEYLKK